MILGSALTLLTWVLIAGAQIPSNGPVTYAYDELGRLVGVIDATGSAAVYSYDAVGNILSITRYTSSQASVITFTPNHGPVGTTVTITGTGFSATATDNTVQFNGVNAVVSAATINQLTVAVPTGATTGPITVVSPAGSVTTADSFRVTSDSGTPTITGFSPQIVNAGTSVTVTGTNFDPIVANDRLIINATGELHPTSASSTSMVLNAPASTGSGHISVSTPTGTATSTADLFLPPTGYSVGAVGSTGRTIPGTGSLVTLSAPNQVGMLIFDGARGQKFSAVASGSTFSSCTFYAYDTTNARILDSRSTTGQFASGSCGTSGGFLDSQPVPATGTYALFVVPGTNTGHVTLAPFVFRDISGTTAVGGSPATIATTFPGQNGTLDFDGAQNAHVSLSVQASTFNGCSILIINPDGTTLTTLGSGCSKTSSFFDLPLLPQSGQYTLLVDPIGAETGTVTLTVNDATDVTGTIATDGSPVTVATTVPGQNVRLSFNGTAGQMVTALLDVNTYGQFGVGLSVLKPDGTVFTSTAGGTGTAFLDDTRYCFFGGFSYVCGSLVLPVTGTYTLLLDPANKGTGQARVHLYGVPADASFSGSLGGSPIPITVGTPGQNGRITFAATQGGRVALAFNSGSFSGVANPSLNFEFLKPDGTLFEIPFSFPVSSTSGFIDYFDTSTFPTSGTYTVVLDPIKDLTGSLTVNLYDATDLNISIPADGTATSVGTTSPGQNAHLNSSPSIGQKVSALVTNIAYGGQQPNLVLTRVDANGNLSNLQTASADGSNRFMEPYTITQTGTYFLLVDPAGQTVGSETVALYTVNDLSGTLTTNGTLTPITTTVPGQNASYTFTANSGQTLTWAGSGVTYPESRCQVKILNPNATTLASHDCFGTNGSWTQNLSLTQTGTYTLVVDPVQSTTGSLSIALTAQ